MHVLLQDPTGAPVVNEKEATIQASKLPICNNHTSSHLACLRPIKKAIQRPIHLPFSSLENKLQLLQTTCQWSFQSEGFFVQISQWFIQFKYFYHSAAGLITYASNMCIPHMHRTADIRFQSNRIWLGAGFFYWSLKFCILVGTWSVIYGVYSSVVLFFLGFRFFNV